MKIKQLSYSDFITEVVTRRNLCIQFVEEGDKYEIFACDGPGLLLETCILKKSSDAADFEANHKNNGNWAIGQRPYPFATGDFLFAPNSSIDTCPAGEQKSVLYQITQKIYVNGGRLVTDGNAVFGDWVEFQIVDHDNLLGYGVDTVLANWIPKWMVDWKSASETVQTPYAGCPPIGMYFRMTYHSAGNIPVGFSVNYLIHIPI